MNSGSAVKSKWVSYKKIKCLIDQKLPANINARKELSIFKRRCYTEKY